MEAWEEKSTGLRRSGQSRVLHRHTTCFPREMFNPVLQTPHASAGFRSQSVKHYICIVFVSGAQLRAVRLRTLPRIFSINL